MVGLKILNDTVELKINDNLFNLDYAFEVVSEINKPIVCNLTLYNLINTRTISSNDNIIEILVNNNSLFKNNFIPIYNIISGRATNITVTKTNVDINTAITAYVKDLIFKQSLDVKGNYVLASGKYLSDYFSNNFKLAKSSEDYQLTKQHILTPNQPITHPVFSVFNQVAVKEKIANNYLIINEQIANISSYNKLKIMNVINILEGLDGSLRVASFYNSALLAGLYIVYNNQEYIITRVLSQYNYKSGFHQELECLNLEMYNTINQSSSETTSKNNN